MSSTATICPDDGRFTLVAGGHIFGAITRCEARLCADWLRENVDVPSLAEFFDAIAGGGK